ncbi:MAG: substrate-binding domain-containing protein [Acidimicrobiia bacterium]|nr:substrate-binding domain-containing protein [Acidimicrobiia bacterium]MDH5420900.1 substrate-binding domain-containing protein [Acidimicrobiia bacterium]MDH5504444.1 substrate-binding domain-containing protein [Acidimicrobiia bacterium]
MNRIKIVGCVAVLAMLLTACSGDAGTTTTADTPAPTTAGETTTTAAATPTTSGSTATTSDPGTDPLAEYGESTDADPALVAKAMGPIDAPQDDPAYDIILAAIARANQDLDQATIDKALECWNAPECDTGSGGDLIMGFADGGGHLNVWRGVTHMEAILQALTYPEIGTIVSTEALWNADTSVAANDIDFLVQRGADFITGYPDAGVAIGDAIKAATAAGVPYIPWSAGWVGLPGQDGALVPGEDYLTVVGENLCALGESMAEVLNDNVGEGKVGVLGGTPGNALSLGWQQCLTPALDAGIQQVGEPADTFWVNDIALQVVLGWLSTDPDIKGYAYEYSDGMNTALQAYDQLGIPVENLTLAMRTDEQTLFCDWVERNEPTYNIWYSAGGNFQSRVAVTAAMMYLKGAEIPSQIDVPHVMRQVTADDCKPDRATPAVSGTSLVPDSVLALMFGSQ